MKFNLLKPLKRIFTALTGEETEDKNLVIIMNKIADTVEESGSGGTVVATETRADEETIVLDKTFNEIRTALQSGKLVLVVSDHIDGDDIWWMSVVDYLEFTEGFEDPEDPETAYTAYYVAAEGVNYFSLTPDGVLKRE